MTAISTNIKTIRTLRADEFQKQLNDALADGWELHGEPSIQTVAQQDTWDGRQRCWTVTTYIQVVKKSAPPPELRAAITVCFDMAQQSYDRHDWGEGSDEIEAAFRAVKPLTAYHDKKTAG